MQINYLDCEVYTTLKSIYDSCKDEKVVM